MNHVDINKKKDKQLETVINHIKSFRNYKFLISCLVFLMISVLSIEITFLSFQYDNFWLNLILNFGSLGILSACLCFFLFQYILEIECKLEILSSRFQLLYFSLALFFSLLFGYYWKSVWVGYFLMLLIPMNNTIILLILFFAHIYLNYKNIKEKNDKNYQTIQGIRKRAFFAALFLELLSIQLFLTINFSRLYDIYKENYYIIALLCALYPVLIGIIKKLILLISIKSGISCGAFIEYISFTYAALPYKILYFQINAVTLGFAIAGIKTFYKLLTYIGAPLKTIILFKLHELKFVKKQPKLFSFDDHIKKFNYLQFIDSQNNINVYSIAFICYFLIDYKIIKEKFYGDHFYNFTLQTILEVILDIFLWFLISRILKYFYKEMKQKSFIDSFYDELLGKYKVTLSVMFLSYLMIFYFLTH